ncbi:hypothetical protein Peur_034399 [Populus x canadensis]
MWKLNHFLSGDDEEREESFLEEESYGLCSLSPTQRMYAFAASLVAGLALMFLFEAAKKWEVNEDMYLEKILSAIYIGCVVLALICALLIHSKILTVFAIIFEICALIWQHLYNSFSEFNNRKFF